MHIAFVEIQNFRKLKVCRIELAERETIFVGANNSGKTSAIDALMLFLKKDLQNKFKTTDFTLSNWTALNHIGEQWVSDDEIMLDDSEKELVRLLPSLDVWLKAEEGDNLSRIVHLIPTLDWQPEQLLGIRFLYKPKKIEDLYKDFRSAYKSARQTEAKTSKAKPEKFLWPENMQDFLDRELFRQFEIRSYILDPFKLEKTKKGVAQPQQLCDNKYSLAKDKFYELIKIHIIGAQRGFSDPIPEGKLAGGFTRLSTQLTRS